MSWPQFKTIWERICNCQQQKFKTKKGLPFIYSRETGAVWVERDGHRINQNLAKSNFTQVYSMMQDKPLSGPAEINKRAIERGESQVRGTSYVWAILYDKRIVPLGCPHF